jgi:hypothetical protein
MNTLRLYGSEIRAGDEFPHTWFTHGPVTVKTATPYRGPLVADLGEGTQIATFVGSNASMTLCANQRYDINRAVSP